MITLFHRPKTRSSRVIFLLEELEAPYQIKLVTTRTRDGAGAMDPANPHPHGKVPAISDDGAIVFESPAIALYLTDKFRRTGSGRSSASATALGIFRGSATTQVYWNLRSCPNS